ncbi:MAG: endonuclease/exonuclease/phosphatase family protein [Gammaproteobacteria bacterium]|nr:endonuclease/exonuclease/phosphatase family protein [Gammaproteobacteria bacterium]
MILPMHTTRLAEPAPHQRLRLLSYNIQVGIDSVRPHHYVTKSWRHLLPHDQRFRNLDRIAQVLSGYDIVALQEVDAGSHRTGNINLTEYLAQQSEFAFWHHQLNRDLVGIARHANGLLSRLRPVEVTEYKLPGFIPGRGALLARYGELVVVLIHLALGQRTRLQQLEYIAEVVAEYEHVVLMGDMNCEPGSLEMQLLFRRTGLREPVEGMCTFPSWRPARNIDHILVSPTLEIAQCQVLNHALSDHLPIAVEIAIPAHVRLAV